MDHFASDSPPDDALLLRCYVREGSEAAFRALAERYLPLVWSVARRVANGDAAMTEDVAQVVLADFARKAHALPQGMPPAGWLHRHTVFTATKAVRGEVRRRAREQVAAAEENPDPMNAYPDTWTELAPHLDTALDRLPDADRTAILLRYYEQRALREVGRVLGTTEEAARKRIERALEKLRSHLKRRGVVPAAAVLALLLRDQSVAAPAAATGRRIVSTAWENVEAGMSVAAVQPWWRRKSVVTGAAAVLVLGLMWLAWRGDSSNGSRAPGNHSQVLSATLRPAPATEETFPPVTVTATLITLPEKAVFTRMLDYAPGTDATLYRELLPQAEALQKLVKPEETFATTGHPLVVLSGPAKPKRMALKPSAPARVAPADPFAVTPDPFASASPEPPSIRLERIKGFSYPTEFDPPVDGGPVTPVSPTIRNAGTLFEANVYLPDEAGRYSIVCNLDHMFAPPEIESWPYRWPDGKKEAANDGLTQPVFHSLQWRTAPVPLPPGEVVLAGMMTLPTDELPGAEKQPRRLFLFLHLQP